MCGPYPPAKPANIIEVEAKRETGYNTIQNRKAQPDGSWKDKIRNQKSGIAEAFQSTYRFKDIEVWQKLDLKLRMR